MLADINLNLGDEPVLIGQQQLEESQQFERVILYMLLAINMSDSSSSGNFISDWVFDPQSLYPS